ncbi:hypothetical protein [Corynebacterium lubricantis]|uniref:hypothetical protein n=1 Tax=Corynebacterium lubricantis TaxID=541095 RepID=UPI0003A4F398|nr:hypothetical protein [Corynebacterium lubricantis]
MDSKLDPEVHQKNQQLLSAAVRNGLLIGIGVGVIAGLVMGSVTMGLIYGAILGLIVGAAIGLVKQTPPPKKEQGKK